MTEDKNNNLWICTEGGGVNVYNRKQKTFKWYKHDEHKNSISHNNVKTIYYDEKNNVMWIGTHLGGLNKLDLKTDIFTHYRSIGNDPLSLPSDIVRDIVPYKDNLIVATQNGVCLFSPETGKCSQMFKDTEDGLRIKMVADLHIDYYGTLWVAATGEGVFSYNFGTSQLKNYAPNASNANTISYSSINNIAQDHNYNLWFSTSGGGLDKYRYETDDFINFDSQRNGLSSDCVYEVQESRYGKLLLITNQGFSQFDHLSGVFYNYSIDNGFPMSAINENALYLTLDGEVFLGGVQGMVSFYEKDLNNIYKEYQIVPYRLTANGNEISIGDRTGILKTALYDNPNIVLSSDYSVFSIEFAVSNYILANKDGILYKLEGFSTDWTNTNGQYAVTYTNLDAGKYTLVIRSASKSEDAPETRINITILPPFYRTGYAYVLYLILLGIILYYINKSYKSRIKLQESLKYEKIHNENMEELNQSKLRFFTNISHEIRTPLTLIIGQMEILIQSQTFTPKVYAKLLSILKNGMQLKTLISELLDFRKQEQGHMIILVSQHNIIDFLYENYLLFEEYANSKNINLKFIKSSDTINVWYDSLQMQKVFNNLISNAFKHTETGDTITISAEERNNEVVIEVTDTGTGIADEDINYIFERFYQSQNVASGTGIGLALTKGIIDLHHGNIDVRSKVNEGTTFVVTLSLGKEQFSEVELDKDDSDRSYVVANNFPPLISDKEDMAEENENQDIIQNKNDIKILIVEDNSSLRDLLVSIFEPLYSVVSASDGEEGLKLVSEENPDIVLSDILMPNMSGVELCKAIKTDINTCHIPVVLLTARISVKHNLEGLLNGADDYITKPFDTKILLSRCNNLVNSRIILKEKFSQQPQLTPQMLATNKLDKDFIDKVMAVIEDNLIDVDFNVDTLASKMGIARTNIYSKIKAITGQTPNKFILTIKLKKAAYMLKNNPELNISEISDLTGFNTSRYFSKCFKEMYQISPLSYRSVEDVPPETES